MTQIRKVVALGAAVVGLALCPSVFAQDDLDDLLKDLEAESEASVETPAEPAAEPASAEEPAAEVEAEAEAEAEAEVEAEGEGEEPAPEAEAEAEGEAEADEEPAAEEPAAEEPAAEEPAAEEPAPAPAVEEPAPAPTAEEPAAEEPAPAPAAEEPAAEEPAPAPTTEEPAAPVSNEKVDEVLSLLGDLDEASKPGPNGELIANLVATERVRRQSLDAQARREINEARQCMKDGEYTEAVHLYGTAAKLLNDRPAVKNLRKECEQGIAEGLYRAALKERELGRRERATQLMNQAVEMRHPRALRMLEKWADEGPVVDKVEEDAEKMHVKTDAQHKAERELIRKHLKRSVQYLSTRNMEKALEECEIVLKNDPYNQEAIRIRKAIQKKRQIILKQERAASRDGMIADVDEAWRPVYAVNAAQLNTKASETVKSQTSEDPERTIEQEIERRMKEMRLPNISFKPPATIIDAVEFFRQASKDYDRPDIEASKRGFNFVLRTPAGAIQTQVVQEEESDDFSSNGDETPAAPSNGLEPISTITASDITFYEALQLVCDSVGYKFIVRGQVVMVMPLDMSTAELIARKYNVPEAFVERVNNANEEIKSMGGFGVSNSSRQKSSDEEEGEGQDWKAFFEEMGVQWPDGSSIKHIKALGKLYVRNTRENLAEFEKVLDELGAQTPLIEIETRFVEVSQQDLNSLGFEWLLNSNYDLSLGRHLGKALGIKPAAYKSVQNTSSSGTTTTVTTEQINIGGQLVNVENTTTTGSTTVSDGGTRFQRDPGADRNIGIDAFGGTSDYQSGNRYLSTQGNHVTGQSGVNDQFMRVNAFLGKADLSMILHMLSQRSDTDLLSAPKIVTKSGENAVIKVVTEFIYPQDYDVQLQSSSSSSGNNGGSQSAVLAIVEPQNFTMREVGVILDVTPTYSEANGGTIDLELKPQVVDEPTWKNYGMKIPFTGNSSLQNFEGIGGIFDGLANSIEKIGDIPAHIKNWIITTETQAAQDALNGLTRSGSDNITYYDAPMEQPFFHIRSIDSKVSITPGSTVVMGGLITEQRKAMDDKVPFLGDLPFIGRLFRSHAEQTNKRNLLIFVTGRLITPSGREIRVTDGLSQSDEAEVKAAPSAE